MDPEPHTTKTSVIPRATGRTNTKAGCGQNRQVERRMPLSRTVNTAFQTIQQLHDRLNAVEEALRIQTEPHPNRTTSSSTPNTIPTIEDDSVSHHCLWEDHQVSYEGNSSFRQQTLLASQIEELRLEEAQTPGVVDELASLRGICHRQEIPPDTSSNRRVRRPHTSKGSELQVPPSDFVVRLLRTVTVLFLFYAVENRKQVEDLCRRVYFSVEPVTIGEITLLHGYLSVLLRDIDFEAHPEFSREETARYYNLCHSNFKSGVETYDFLVTGFANKIQSLKAQLDGNLPLQWSVMSAAARHVLALGYHRKAKLAALPLQEARRARRLFWHVYFADHGLTLTQGKAPIIQDIDIDAESFEISQNPERRPWDTSFAAFIELSRIQSRIYEGLYSPAASRSSEEERRAVADHLSKRLSQWYESWRSVDYSHAYRQELFEFTFDSFDVVYYSILTLTHRGASSSNSASGISEECFDAARKGLTAHAAAYPRSASGGYSSLFTYAVWTHLYSSFTPYIITFLHCIGNSNIEDLHLLRNALEICERLSGLVESCKRQYELCRALYRIAEAYIQAKKGLPCIDTPLESAIHLPLQQPTTENWSAFDSNMEPNTFSELHVDDWSGNYLGQMSFTLDNQLGKNNH
ncbi:c6 transcription factor [Colletotrichum incanum]|uniref:C6 transcription factor n=1 Tax=Colletotrichum incanum TaxID=1573173 RepID=A0A161VY07_COLIC|nr:c6 transcription factor [Colletotrichum incanum]